MSEWKYTCIELVHFIVQQKVTNNVNSALFISHIKEGWWAGFEGNCSKLCISGLKPHHAAKVSLKSVAAGVVTTGAEQTVGE